VNYQKLYNLIVEQAKNADRKKGLEIYYESHHIIPKCLGGTDKKENLVLLTAKEHFLCHKLLVEIYPSNSKLLYALWGMSNQKNAKQKSRYQGSAREYERVRKVVGELISKLNSGRIHTKESNERRSRALTGVPKPNISKALTGIKRPYQSVRQVGKGNPNYGKVGAMLGKVHTEEAKSKVKESKKQIKTCPHCKKTGTINSLIRWHFDNCKKKSQI
jgi:ribosomal protein L37AE/L43A